MTGKMSINEELNAVRKWLTAKDVYKRLQADNITALFITGDGESTLAMSGVISKSEVIPVTRGFITAMLENLEDEDDRKNFKAAVTTMFLNELLEEYKTEKADESKSDNKR